MAKNEFLKILGKSVLLASMQFSIGSVEMSSKFSVRNFSTDQKTLQCAADALDQYNLVGLLWAVGVCCLLYAQYGTLGLACAIGTNLAVLAWIDISYFHAFKQAARDQKLHYPRTFWGMLS
jgi:hypothetical protein